MKKILLLLFTVLLTASYSPLYKAQDIEHIKVSTEIKPYFNEFVEIIEKHDLEIDWKKINSIGF